MEVIYRNNRRPVYRVQTK